MKEQIEHHSALPTAQSASDGASIPMEGIEETVGEDRLEERRNPRRCLSCWIFALIALLFLIVGAVYAFPTTFGQFRAYDDEGCLMISVQGYSEGNALYDRVNTVYGPVYYFYEWVLHKVAAIPLTNDTTAGLCVAHWILGAAILALAGFRMTRSFLLSAFIFMQAIVHLEPLANEPGHPQEVVVMLLGLAGLVAAGGLKRRETLPLLAAIGTGLLLTKINVGAFFGMALALSMLCCTSGGGIVRVGVWAVTLLVCAFPFLLMWPHHDEAWVRNYSLEMSLSILAVGLVANVFVTERVIRLRDWVRAAATSAVVSGLLLLILVATGSTLSATWESLVSGAAKIGGIFHVPLHLERWPSWPRLTWDALGVAALTVYLKRRATAVQVPLAIVKTLYGIMGTWVLVFEPKLQLAFLLPWAWLLIVGTKKTDNDLFSRIFLAFLAVWQGLQAYPVAGTQVTIGTLMGVLVFSVCLWDAMRIFANTSLLRPTLQKAASVRGGRLAQLGVLSILLALLAIFSLKWCNPTHVWREYQAKQSMDLPGCHYRRIDSAEAIQYRKLAEFLKTNSDTFYIFPGLNSMYFWTDKRPPTYFKDSGEGILPTEPHQLEVVEALKRANRPLMVLRRGTGLDGTAPEELKEGPLADFVREEYYQIGAFQIGANVKFKILAPKLPSKASG